MQNNKDIASIARYVQNHIDRQCEAVWKEHFEKLSKAYQEIGELSMHYPGYYVSSRKRWISGLNTPRIWRVWMPRKRMANVLEDVLLNSGLFTILAQAIGILADYLS